MPKIKCSQLITIAIVFILFLGVTPQQISSAASLNAYTAADFVITVKTDNPGTSSNTQFTIPTTGGGYNYNVDCNNDSTDEVTGASGDYTCNYGAAGTYTVVIKDNSGVGTGFPRIYFDQNGDRLKLLTIEQWGTGKWSSMENAFFGCENLTSSATDAPDLSGVTDLSNMFSDAHVFNGDIGHWDVSKVTDMHYMFDDAFAFNQDIGGWNTGNVTDMSDMFSGALAFNQDIGGWNTAKVTNMRWMFQDAAAFNQDIGGWNTSNVEDMGRMFSEALAFNQDIGGWNTAKVDDSYGMFVDAQAFNQDIGGWNMANVTDMSEMFEGATSFNQDIGGWDTGNVTDMESMFEGATAFNQDIGGWDVSELLDATEMFLGATLSTTNYDSLLIGWNAQTLKNGVTFHGGNSTYCAGAAARANIVSGAGHNWTITADGGLYGAACPPTVLYGTNTVPADKSSITPGPTQIFIEFDKDVTSATAELEANYLLVEDGANGFFDTQSCAGGRITDDTQITVNTATYDDSNPYIATLDINGGIPLPAGDYRLFVCGTTSIEDALGNDLNGGFDSTLDFTVRAAARTLPATGFAPGRVTTLTQQPMEKVYVSSDLWMEIPKLGVKMDIVGVPVVEGEWDVAWLGNSAGWLESTAFPTYAGNTGITAHVWDADNNPGPFTNLRKLQHGDVVKVHAWGYVYTYSVRYNYLTTPTNMNPLRHETYDWVTLLTCERYSETYDNYRYRRVVRAVLVDVSVE